MKNVFAAVLSPIPDGSGYFARIPDVSGCITTGNSIPDTMDNIRDALALTLCGLEDLGKQLPNPSNPEAIQHDDDSFLALIDIDIEKYRKETDMRSVRKNVSMPAWLSNMADARGINCSQVLQDALKLKLGIT